MLSLDEVSAEVSNVEVKALNLGAETVVRQADGRADYSLHADISFEADAEYDDPGYFIWDEETRTAIYYEKIHRRIERTVEVPLDVTVRFDPQDLRSGTVEQIVVNRNAVLILEPEDEGNY
ncbi:MAG: hypothetical protein CYG60_11370 [Actinobacteria bacterium]|nr:MAG: hypothetical protein CYG60_11370 [Actinomycetota bacterium]